MTFLDFECYKYRKILSTTVGVNSLITLPTRAIRVKKILMTNSTSSLVIEYRVTPPRVPTYRYRHSRRVKVRTTNLAPSLFLHRNLTGIYTMAPSVGHVHKFVAKNVKLVKYETLVSSLVVLV